MENKEQLELRIKKVLSKKSFSRKAKAYLLKAILYIDSIYASPKYIKTTKEEYVEEYITILQSLEECKIIDLSEINNKTDRIIKRFYDSIKECPDKKGNLNYLNGKYVFSKQGSYVCRVTGYTDYQSKSIYILDDEDTYHIYLRIQHEMTKLRFGKKLFPIVSNIPLAFHIRSMFMEGYATVQEDYIKPSKTGVTVELVEEENITMKVNSNYQYALYGTLYKLLQLIFGVNTLEQFSENDLDLNMIFMLTEMFPDIPVDYIFAHLTYILNCYEKNGKSILRKSIDYYKMAKNVENKKLVDDIKEIERKLSFTSKELEMSKKRMIILEQILSNKKLSLSSKENTLVTEQYIESLKQEFNMLKKQVKKLESTMLLLSVEKEVNKKDELQLEHDQYEIALENTCIKNPSLETSFQFLEQIALTRIQEQFINLQDLERKMPILAQFSEIEQIQNQVGLLREI